MQHAYIARQPIVDASGHLVAYELLFRNGLSNQAGLILDEVKATAQVLENALNNMGVQNLVGPHKAFINCSRDMLLSGILLSLDPQRFVLEILESVEIDPLIVSSVAALHEAGYIIALDDFVYTPSSMHHILPLLPYLRYVKLDLMANSPEQRQQATQWVRSKGIEMLAEKVETEQEFHLCRSEGCSLFQGYFFARPELISTQKIDSRITGILQILQLLRKDPDIKELEEAFKREPEVTFNLLRYMNSAAIALRNPISSIRQAIALVGLHNLQQWLMLMLYAKEGNGDFGQSPLFENAVQRARFMEDLAKHIDPQGALPEQAFLVGVMSRLDALCRVPIHKIIQNLDLGPEITHALTEGKGVLGQLLFLIASLESGAEDLLTETLNTLQLPEEIFRISLEESYAWCSKLQAK